nr:hypothetical protein [Tanacetum cinerariifolium]
MGRDTVQLETAVNTISHEYLLEFTSEYGIPETLHPALPGPKDRIVDFSEGKIGWMFFSKRSGRNTPQCYTKPLDSLKNWNNRFFWVDERVFSTVVDWRTNAPKDGMSAAGTYSLEAVRVLDTYHMDLFNLIRAPNPTKVKIGSHPRAPHEGAAAPKIPSFEDVPATAASGAGQAEETTTMDPLAAPESRKRGHDGTDVNASSKSLQRDHADPQPSRSSHGGKSLAAIQLGLASTVVVPEDAPVGVSDPDLSSPGIVAAGDPESENASSPAEVRSSGSVYQPEWGVTNGSLLDTPEACQDLVDHAAFPGYFSELRHMRNEEFLGQYNVNLARQVAMGSQLRLRFKQEAKLLRKSVAQVARQDKRIQAQELEIKNLEALLETEADMKRAAEDKSVGLTKELEDMRARFSDLQVSNEHLSQQVATLQEQVSGEEKLKAAFEEFKRYEDDRVERQCAELDARLDAVSVDFDEELYPHMLTAIAGRRWVIGHRLRLAVMKCDESLDMRQVFPDVVSARITKGMSEGLRHGVEHGQAQLNVESIEAYDPEAEAKFVAALQVLKDLKYPLLEQLEGLKDAPIDVIMASLYLESDTGEDAPSYIRDLRPSSSQLTIPVYPEVRDPRNPWAYKEEMKLADSIAANISHAEKKKKCHIVCRTHGVGSAHHARSGGVSVSVPTMVPEGLALLLSDAATQTEFDDT